MIDSHGRTLNYLRVSVTDRCNLRCKYCMPEHGIKILPPENILRFEEIIRIIKIMVTLGITRIRITGGEPLVRKDIVFLIRKIKQIKGIEFLGLTTNGVLLERFAQELLSAGVDGLNISLDTVDVERYKEITRYNELPNVMKGLNKALALGFPSVKINCVLTADSKKEDWLHIVELARTKPLDVRLIEFMPIIDSNNYNGIQADEALKIISQKFGSPKQLLRESSSGPAEYWQFPGFTGRIGAITAMSHNFCNQCNRLRLTASGNIKLCLFYDLGISLKTMIRDGTKDIVIANEIQKAIQFKPKRHQGARQQTESGEIKTVIESNCGMYDLGG